MKKLLSWLDEAIPAIVKAMCIIIIIVLFIALFSPRYEENKAPIEDRFTLYEDKDTGANCYILDEGKANQTMSCMK